jgi:hypothetical protein
MKMDEKYLKELLRGRRDQPVRRSWRCPDEMQLAAYVDRKLEDAARESVEAHVADCDFCLNQVSFLVQAADWTDPAGVPTQVLLRARNLVPRKSGSITTWGWRWAAASAAAACLVLLFAFIALRFRTQPAVNAPSGQLIAQQHQPDIAPVPQTTPAIPRPVPTHSAEKPTLEPVAPTIRRGGQDLLPTVIFPRNGAALRRSELDFRWQPLADTVFYDIRVVTAEGDLILESKTEDTHLRIDDDVPLQPGAKYFVSVRAHLRQGQTVKSAIVSFRISEQ